MAGGDHARSAFDALASLPEDHPKRESYTLALRNVFFSYLKPEES